MFLEKIQSVCTMASPEQDAVLLTRYLPSPSQQDHTQSTVESSVPFVRILSVGACLLRLYSIPAIRKRAGLDLLGVGDPLTELRKSEESRAECGASTLLSVMRSRHDLILLSTIG